MDQTAAGELLHQRGDASGLVKIAQVVGAAGRHGTEVRGFIAVGVEGLECQRHACLLRDGGQVERGVRRSAKGHIHGNGVCKGLCGHDGGRPQVPVHQLHDLHSRFLRQTDPLRPDGRDGPVSGKRHPQDLRETVHRVGREHPRAGADARTGASLRIAELIHRHRPDLGLAYVFEDVDQVDLLPLELAGQHGAAADHDGRDVEARRSHEHPGDDLVAVGDEDEAVERVGHRHRLDGVGDQFAGAQRVLHPLVAHDDPVADPDREELHRRPSGHPDARLDRLGDLVQMKVARNEFVCGIGDADHRPFDFPVRQSQRLEQGTVRRPLQSLFHYVGTHGFPPY